MRGCTCMQAAAVAVLLCTLLPTYKCTAADPSSVQQPVQLSHKNSSDAVAVDAQTGSGNQQQQQQGTPPVASAAVAAAARAAASNTTSSSQARRHSNNGGAHPRLDIAEISAMPATHKYKVLMLLAWHDLTTSNDTTAPLSYWALAGLHGMTWTWNGQKPETTTGFCRHNTPAFGPWHRPYTLMFEKALRIAAAQAVSRIQDKALRQQYMKVLPTLRLPYWDWTTPTVPSLLLADNVTVINSTGHFVSIYNPFREYRYPKQLDSRPRLGVREPYWPEALAKQSYSLANALRLFVASQAWKCTYDAWVGFEDNNGCVGNLEQLHNDIHAIIGGLNGDMATMKYGAFDPLFWIHHATIDRALWLFQNNGGGWEALSNYSPFLNLTGNASSLSSFGYTYRDPYSVHQVPANSQQSTSKKLLASSSGMHTTTSPSSTDLDAGTEIGSPEAMAAVQRQLVAWSHGYDGYTWQVRFRRIAKAHTGLNQTVQIHVLMKGVPGHDDVLPGGGKTLNPNLLRLRGDYCGSVSGWNDGLHTVSNRMFSQAVDLTRCMVAAGLNPNAAPLDAADFSKGPAAAAVRTSDLKIMVLSADGEDITEKFNMGQPVISWALPVQQQQQQSNMRLSGSHAPSNAGVYALRTGVFE